jgi:hypothetical protein
MFCHRVQVYPLIIFHQQITTFSNQIDGIGLWVHVKREPGPQGDAKAEIKFNWLLNLDY